MTYRFNVSGRIAKPVAEVFEAVVNPEHLSAFFTTGGAKGRLETGATVLWDFADFPGAFPVKVERVVPNREIVFHWGSADDAAEGETYVHDAFKPWRIQALAFKAIRKLFPEYDLWRDFPYEYAFGKLPIDVINGSPLLREWVDDEGGEPGDLEALAAADEAAWAEEREPYLIYRG